MQTNSNGDVWKIAFELLNSSGLEYKILAIDGGQCVVFRNSTQYNIPSLNNEFSSLNYDYFFENFKKLPILDLDSGMQWISQRLKKQ